MFQVSLFLSAFLLMIPLLEITPDPFKFTAFFTCAPVLFTAFAPDFRKENGKVTMERKVHMLGAKIGGVISFIWAVWMAYSFGWWLLAVVGALGIVFYALNKKYNRPVLFLEYWVFSYPYAILLIIGLYIKDDAKNKKLCNNNIDFNFTYWWSCFVHHN